MKCPTDDNVLQLSERLGIEIDYCPSCRGVWLDRGEIDKVIEVATRAARGQTRSAAPEDSYLRRDIRGWDDGRGQRQTWDDDDRWDDHRESSNGRRPSKRRSLLGEIPVRGMIDGIAPTTPRSPRGHQR